MALAYLGISFLVGLGLRVVLIAFAAFEVLVGFNELVASASFADLVALEVLVGFGPSVDSAASAG